MPQRLTSPPWPRVLSEAQSRFKIRRFRPGQREVLEHVFAGRNALALMPTGAGKSLTYQLPALFLPHPVLVVSPLIALMQDQQEKAEDAHIRVEKLDSTLTRSEAEQAAEDIASGAAQLIYVTPERLQKPEFLHELTEAGGISLLVVDEAHTIAQWGHDFRPAFLAIGEARKKLGNPPVLALTATATPDVVEEILAALGATDASIVQTGSERDNLALAVRPTVNNAAKFARILAMLEEIDGTGIVYTASVRSANELYEFLTEHGVSAGRYHGKMSARTRESAQAEFMRGDYKVMIATKAFGLGIDKRDIRFVFHFEFPDSLESYFQEAGRAGRDGKPAAAMLLYRLEDKRIQSFFLAGRYPRLAEVEAVYTAIPTPKTPGAPSIAASGDGWDAATSESPASPPDDAAQVSTTSKVGRRRTQVILNLLGQAGLIRRTSRGYVRTGKAASEEVFAELIQTYTDRAVRDKERLADMMHYAETPDCRTQVLRVYFDEPEGEPCRRCDNCAREFGKNRGQTAPLIQPDEQPATANAEPVHVVETSTGSYQTTRDQPAPAPELPFANGDRVRHKRFGTGVVLDLHDQMVLVDFPKGKKRVLATFLKAAA